MKQYIAEDIFRVTQYENAEKEHYSSCGVSARYIFHPNPADEDNILIEALPPPLDMGSALDQFQYIPYYHAQEQQESQQYRLAALNQLYSIRIVQEHTFSLYNCVYQSLRQSYHLRVCENAFGFFNDAAVQDMPSETGEIMLKKKQDKKAAGLSIIGVSGSGKTTSVNEVLAYYPQVIIHDHLTEGRLLQIVYIKIECPPNGSMKSFYDFCLDALEEATDRDIVGRHKCKTALDKERLFKQLAKRWHLGILVIDEIQHLSQKRASAASDHILTLANDINIPIIYIGTEEALDLFKGSKLYTQRRMERVIHVNRYQNDASWEMLCAAIWEFQWMRKRVALTEDMIDALYYESAGIIDRLISLFYCVQEAAIKNENIMSIKVDNKFIHDISKKNFAISREQINQMAEADMLNENKLFKRVRQINWV